MPSFRTVQVHTRSNDFRVATEIIDIAQLPTATAGHVVVQNHYVGINATDINVTQGFYPGCTSLPFGCGLEATGVVTEVGEGVTSVSVGDAVLYQKIGAFAEYVEVPAKTLIKTAEVTPALLSIAVCGISASIALEYVGHMATNETVLVTAAAGGTGQFAVQLAKLAGNHVIGTCSSNEKVEYLKSLGCDRVINYTEEDVGAVLKAEYPKGLDLVFEAVGGEMFKAAVENIATHGRIILFGNISTYKGPASELLFRTVYPKLLMKSASLHGFILYNHMEHVADHITKLVALIKEGKLNAGVDPTEFKGLEGIPDAIDHMYARKNIGKLVVRLV